MNLYALIKPLLFQLEAEKAHHLTLKSLAWAERVGLLGLCKSTVSSPKKVMGITFPNAVGLAAGLDKNAEVIDGMAALGFGFIEVGTVTPRPQPGNPQPRLFRVPAAQGIINRFGFNNDGVDALIKNVEAAKFNGVLGINIGKNFDTPNEKALDDYVFCMRKVYPYATYITVNISSPNTKNLRDLQQKNALSDLLAGLKTEQERLAQAYQHYVPLALKIAPDLTPKQIEEIADLLLTHEIDGVIATNTTLARDAVQGMPNGDEQGGLSGAPVKMQSTLVIQQLAQQLKGQIPIIGVGGILSVADAQEKMAAGASLVQVYSGLIYRGPQLIKAVASAL